MLTESFIAATYIQSTKTNTAGNLKDVGLILQDFQPRNAYRHDFKKCSAKTNSVAASSTHVFAAQADRAVVHVYSREKGNQEATVAFPERVRSLAFIGESCGFLICGTEGGRLATWDVASGWQSSSSASHLQPVSLLVTLPGDNFILSGSSDSNIHVWSLSKLVSFTQFQSSFSQDSVTNGPVRTFSSHRTGITAIACGHSRSCSNFAASASQDGTCYIWNTVDCQVLRTILLHSTPLSFAIDPADRVLYSGLDDGSIQSYSFYSTNEASKNIQSTDSQVRIELGEENSWSSGPADLGSAQCLTLSYDGTVLLSGHSSGKILGWDVAKRRVQEQVTDLGHSVTNLFMQEPAGYLHKQRPRVQVKTITKPKLDSLVSIDTGTSGVPTEYLVKVQITKVSPPSSHEDVSSHETSFRDLLTCPVYPKNLIDEAVLELQYPKPEYDISFEDDSTSSKLQSRISVLEENLAIFIVATEKSRARRLARVEAREELKRRQVLSNGDGDAGAYEQDEMEIDELSDEQELGEEVYGDV